MYIDIAQERAQLTNTASVETSGSQAFGTTRMKIMGCFFVFIYFAILACTDLSAEVTRSAPTADADTFMQKHVEITQQGIHAQFINAISKGKHKQALSKLHPKISEAWTIERFIQDWNSIKNQLPSGWNPEATSSFSGNSPQGLYEQATFRLESDWDSIASLDLVSMKIEGKERIVKIQIRTPRIDEAPIEVVSLSNRFVEAILAKKYEKAQDLFSDAVKKQYPPAILSRLKNILGDKQDSASRSYSRLSANTVWYDAVMLRPPNDPATHLEIIIQADTNSTRIVALTFKGRMN